MDNKYIYFNTNRSGGTANLSLAEVYKNNIGQSLKVGIGYNDKTYPLPRVYASAFRGEPVPFAGGVKPFLTPLQRSRTFIHTPNNTINPTL